MDLGHRPRPADLRQGAAHDAYGAPPRAIDARPDDYQAFRARREEQLGQWREQPEHAEAARADQTDAERLEHVADLLERVQPTPLETEQIKAPLGAPWIPARDVHDFMMETFNVRGHGLTPGKLSQYSVDWIPQLGQWRVGYSGGGDIDYKAARTYGTEDRNPFQLLEACLDNAQITVTKDSPTETTASGKPKRVKDQKATMAAIEKANAIRDAWNQWVFKDPDRAQRLTALYNRRFNGMRPRHVDGSYLTTPGITHGVALRPHQKDAVARALRSDEAPSSRTSSEPARRSRASHSPTRRNVSARRPSRCSWSPTTSWTSGPATCSGSIRPAESSSWTRTRNATPNR